MSKKVQLKDLVILLQGEPAPLAGVGLVPYGFLEAIRAFHHLHLRPLGYFGGFIFAEKRSVKLHPLLPIKY